VYEFTLFKHYISILHYYRRETQVYRQKDESQQVAKYKSSAWSTTLWFQRNCWGHGVIFCL